MLRLTSLLALVLALVTAPWGSTPSAQTRGAVTYSLSYLPDPGVILVCYDRAIAAGFLLALYEEMVARGAAEQTVALARMTGRIGGGKEFPCDFVEAGFIPMIPIDPVDMTEAQGLDWGEAREQFFVRAAVTVGGKSFTQLDDGRPLLVLVSDFVVEKR